MTAVELQITPRHATRLPVWLGRAAYALFIDTLRLIDPSCSAALHNGDGLKPFTASIVTHRQPTPKRPLSLRYTAYKPDVTKVLLNGLLPYWAKHGLTLQAVPFTLTEVYLELKHSPWVGCATFPQIIDEANERQRMIKLHFGTPTTFKSSHGHSIPLPEPGRVFGSLIQRWNAFAPFMFPDDMLKVLDELLTIEALHIQTSQVAFKNKREDAVGFTGEVSYWIESNDRELVRYLNALADFALYSGVGSRTTVGMGQVRRVRQEMR